MVMLSVLDNPVLTLQLGILGKLLHGVNGQNSEGMCKGGKPPGTGKLYTDVCLCAPPTPVDAWSMALGLRQRFIIIGGDRDTYYDHLLQLH